MKRKLMAMIAAVTACLAFTVQARTITVTENKEGGATTSFNLTFSAGEAGTTNSLWMAYGKADGGTGGFAGWTNVKYLGAVPGDVNSTNNVALPDGWGTDVYRLRFILTSGGDVPGGERLEYIKATQTGNDDRQYIMTPFVATGDSAVEMEFAFHDGYPSGSNNAFFCSRGASSGAANYGFLLYWTSSKQFRLDYNSKHQESADVSGVVGSAKHAVHVDYSGVYLDNSETPLEGTTHPHATFSGGDRPMTLFVANRAGSASSLNYYCKYSLYSFKAYTNWTNWTNGTDTASLSLDLVPCVKHDGIVGLYNKVDGAFYENIGTGEFTAGDVIPSETAVTESASELVSYPEPGWRTSDGKHYYPYVNPLYIADIADSNSIDQVTFKRVDLTNPSVTNDVPYATFTESALTGTIVKCGNGTLTFNQNISAFTGPVHVEDGVAIGVCSNCFGSTTWAGQGPNQRTYVHSGATLVMDAVGNQPGVAEYNAVYYEGEGHPGMGGAYVIRNGEKNSGQSYWQSGVSSCAVGPARIYVDFPSGGTTGLSGSPQSDFSLKGQNVLLYGREVGSRFVANSDSIKNIGNLVVSNMTLQVSNGAELQAENGSASTIRFRGGSQWIWYATSDQTRQTATTFIDDMEFARIGRSNTDNFGVDPWGANGATKRNWYYGPMVLNDHFRIYNLDVNRRSGCTFAEKVSGPCGFRPYQDKGRKVRLNLLNDNNDFEGGIVLDQGTLGVYGATAVPSHEGAGLVSITNGYVYFGRKLESASVTNSWVNFTMPVTEFVNDGAVTNGTGAFKGLVKKGTGTLDYNSQMGGDYLDLQGGTVKFNTQYRSAYMGDNASAAPDGYEAALPVFTTLKGTTGTLDLSDAGGNWTVANVEGSPAISGNLTVTGNWPVEAAAIGNNVPNISGTLTFGEGATITVSGDPESVQRPQGGFVIARATSISGLPSLVGCKGWTLQASGGELRLTKTGLIVIVR